MSSSGLIYAGIVGAWAVYLVPVWLRREEQLNEARQKARYAAAIRTLGRTEQFQKRWLTEETLAATGTDGPVRKQTGPARPKAPDTKPADGKPAARTTPGGSGKPAAKPAEQRRTQPQTTLWLPEPEKPTSPRSTAPAARKAATASRNAVRHRGILVMRRRRVVAFLFTLATAGAFVSAVLGLDYIWAMLAPAALFSLYIVNIRRDERLRAEERYRRRQALLAAERRRERQERSAAPEERYEEPPQTYRRAANG